MQWFKYVYYSGAQLLHDKVEPWKKKAEVTIFISVIFSVSSNKYVNRVDWPDPAFVVVTVLFVT